ncbi:MAG: disulfide bond formation protein B [Patescibacteria group bacterium]
MVSIIQMLVPYIVLGSHLLFTILFLAVIFKNSWGRKITAFLGIHGIVLALLVLLVAVGGSLFYSEIVGFEPCPLCWWQRLFIYPQLILFLTALKFKDRSVFRYAWRLSLLAAMIALYHQYVYMGGESLLPCTALGGACSKIYVFAFGYITIPMMSLTISLYVLLLARADRIYRNENYHS